MKQETIVLFAGILFIIVAAAVAGCTNTGKTTAATPTQTVAAGPATPGIMAGTPVAITAMAPAKAFDRVSNGTTVRAQPGDNLTISLAENPTTGYSWNVTTTGGLAITKDEYVLSDASGNLVGSGGIHTWYLTAGQAATQKFTAIYKRPWEQTTGNEMMFVMTFTVSEATGGMVFNETNNGTTVTLPMNTPFAIRLNENPTTGFSWNATISDSLTVISDQYIPPEAVRPGAGGVHEWSLKGTKAGTQTFSAIYKRPWEAATGSEPSFAMTFRIGSGSL